MNTFARTTCRATLLCVSLVGVPRAAETAWRGSVEDLVASQRAVEGVRWRHRIWPSENPQPKPDLSAVLGDDVLRERVDDGLRKARALEILWRQSISHEDLQTELDRMARNSQDKVRLAETWSALGNDPARIGEVLIRPLLADRRIRELYAGDARFHGTLKSKAIAALRRVAAPTELRGVGAQYVETTYRLTPDSEEEWNRRVNDLSRAFDGQGKLPLRRVSRLIEDENGFRATVVLERDAASIRVGRAFWPKTPFEAWWSNARTSVSAAPIAPDTSLVVPSLSVESACTANTWSRMDPDMPTARALHSAVWTGSELLIWGGQEGLSLREGFRYDPVADTWTRMSVAGAPIGRAAHFAFWTGTEMLLWGGYNSQDALDVRGVRYNPTSDVWTPLSDVDQPAARDDESAVWTGTQLIVWGGSGTDEGGRYTLASDTWAPTSLVNAPSPRRLHTAVWTGSKMVVWGGDDGVGTALDSGGVYDPSSDTWTPTHLTGAPNAREHHTAIWNGTRMLIWAGDAWDAIAGAWTYFGDGRQYDPVQDKWTAIKSVGAPSPRAGHRAVWTGSLMIVWGGYDDVDLVSGGGRYNPSTDSWQAVTTTAAPAGRQLFTAVWCGTRMVVWGGDDGFQPLDSGGRYNPVTDSWTATRRTSTRPTGRDKHAALWTGSEMIVLGGDSNALPGAPYDAYRYDPSLDVWQATPTTALRGETIESPAVWTGTQVLQWGGLEYDPGSGGFNDVLDSGVRYNPTTGAWSPIASAGRPAARFDHTAVWTGTRMIVWGGAGPSSYFNDGGRYDPATDSWSPTSMNGAPLARSAHSALWTGHAMVVWGGHAAGGDGEPFIRRSGGRYDPLEDSWTPTSLASAPAARYEHGARWTGRHMVIWGGRGFTENFTDGARYDPASDAWLPMAANSALPVEIQSAFTCGKLISWGSAFGTNGGVYDPESNAWTPTSPPPDPTITHYFFPLVSTNHLVIVWGGQSRANWTSTGATYCACASQPAPGKVVVVIDKTTAGVRVFWAIDPYASSYDMIRGSLAMLRSSHGNFTPAMGACLANDAPLTWYDDTDPVDPGGNWYLARASSIAGIGSYDDGSTSQLTPRDAGIASSPSACP